MWTVGWSAIGPKTPLTGLSWPVFVCTIWSYFIRTSCIWTVINNTESKLSCTVVSNTLLCSLGLYPLPGGFHYFLPDFGSCEKLSWALAFPTKEMGQGSVLGVAETSSWEKVWWGRGQLVCYSWWTTRVTWELIEGATWRSLWGVLPPTLQMEEGIRVYIHTHIGTYIYPYIFTLLWLPLKFADPI